MIARAERRHREGCRRPLGGSGGARLVGVRYGKSNFEFSIDDFRVYGASLFQDELLQLIDQTPRPAGSSRSRQSSFQPVARLGNHSLDDLFILGTAFGRRFPCRHEGFHQVAPLTFRPRY